MFWEVPSVRIMLPAILLLFACASPNRLLDPDEKALVDFCSRFLDDYSNGRFDAVEAYFTTHAVIAVDGVDHDRQKVYSLQEFMDRTRQGNSFREWVSGEPVVLRDHKIACVWAPYIVEQEGKRYEGIDVFQLIRLEGAWRIASLSYTNQSSK